MSGSSQAVLPHYNTDLLCGKLADHYKASSLFSTEATLGQLFEDQSREGASNGGEDSAFSREFSNTRAALAGRGPLMSL